VSSNRALSGYSMPPEFASSNKPAAGLSVPIGTQPSGNGRGTVALSMSYAELT
jgi:hypothetical protein